MKTQTIAKGKGKAKGKYVLSDKEIKHYFESLNDSLKISKAKPKPKENEITQKDLFERKGLSKILICNW